jgi:ubiquinone/menaquinone biosynthesis C-methylase UbiE
VVATSTSERSLCVVQTLAVEPSDNLLEIGCGRGVAVSLTCEKLIDGKITAIDRSVAMINIAGRRNRRSVSSGKAVLRAC